MTLNSLKNIVVKNLKNLKCHSARELQNLIHAPCERRWIRARINWESVPTWRRLCPATKMKANRRGFTSQCGALLPQVAISGESNGRHFGCWFPTFRFCFSSISFTWCFIVIGLRPIVKRVVKKKIQIFRSRYNFLKKIFLFSFFLKGV